MSYPSLAVSVQRLSGIRRVAAVLVVAICAACAPGLPTDPGFDVIHSNRHLEADPTTFMTAVGCAVQTGADSAGSVAVRLLGGSGTSHFRCGGVPADSVHRAIASYRQAARDSVGGAAAQAPLGGGEWVTVHFDCTLNTEIVQYDGYYDVYQWIDGCVYFYTVPGGGGGGNDGGGGGGDQGSQGNQSNQNTVIAPDSACRASADSRPSIIPALPGQSDYLPSYGPLGSQDVVRAVTDLGDAAWSAAGQHELGGVIILRAGQYAFVPMVNIHATETNNVCQYADATQYVANPGELVVALVHTHPPENTPLGPSNCPVADSAGRASLGPSLPDQSSADNTADLTNTNYVVQRDASGTMTITRFGTNGDGSRYIEPGRYTQSTPHSCAVATH
jgi:hypothetical protein